MAEQKVIPTPVSDKEAELLQRTFKDNEYLLKLLRKLFFGFEISSEEKDLIKKTFTSAELRNALRKKTYPVFDIEATPIGQLADFWLGTEQNILGASESLIHQVIDSKKRVGEMLNIAFKLLENPDGEKINLDYNPNSIVVDRLQTWLLARNLFMRTIEQGLLFAKLTAEQYTKPKEEKKKIKDSTK